jgi:membrane protein involved in colicin uptake
MHLMAIAERVSKEAAKEAAKSAKRVSKEAAKEAARPAKEAAKEAAREAAMSSTSIANGDVICCGRANCQGTRSTPVLRGLTNSASESGFVAPPAERSWGHQSGWS